MCSAPGRGSQASRSRGRSRPDPRLNQNTATRKAGTVRGRREKAMSVASAAQSLEATAIEPEAEPVLTDGFHLVIDALKLNGISTIYGVPGIPITDLGRLAQAAGMRVISFRHEQNAGNAAAIAGFLTQKPGRLPDRLGARLPQRADRAGERHHQLLPDDPDLGLVRARGRRPAAGRLRGDGPARHRQAALQGRLPRAARRGHRHRRRPRDPRRGVGAAGRRLSRPAGEAARPDDGGRGRQPVAGQGDRPGAARSLRRRRRSPARSRC